ncbi:Alpha/Beta hydrolase protein, partial [Ochromonadaceae sp. CCMP2298]
MSAKGLVLFCSPNAGFYEGVSQCDINGSWVGFYLKQGFDVCMFNYRGYGLSTGTPTPDAVKHDACQLYLHLQQTRAPARIIVHGESIGGMIACHLARSYPVDALVCDRTFASLDATAARLLGPWAGYGLKYCTLWNTNVAADYLACTCPKVILQDPDDEIIANLASLKNGVAMRI